MSPSPIQLLRPESCAPTEKTRIMPSGIRMPQRTNSPNSAMFTSSRPSVAPAAASGAARRQASGSMIRKKDDARRVARLVHDVICAAVDQIDDTTGTGQQHECDVAHTEPSGGELERVDH